jgi:thioredoxin-like negative regulator of GroEL
MRRRLGALLLLAGALAGCARPPALRIPQGEDYVFPVAAPQELTPDEARRVQAAWQKVLAGDAPGASRDFTRLLAGKPGLVPAATGLAYARLRAGRFPEAREGFARVLEARPGYLPALVGAASAAFRAGAVEDALSFYRRAQAEAPDDARVRRSLGEVKLQATERRVASAREALNAGKVPVAIEEFRQALAAAPEVAEVRLELAQLLVATGDAAGAAALLEQDPQAERAVLLRLGEILIGLQEYSRALDVYRRLLARDPEDVEALRRAREARDALELFQMPEEYQRIPAAPRITRADLAALVAVKVTALSRVKERVPRVAVDISGSWAREHVAAVLALDILDLYPNHTFQPGGIVRRGDLARVVGRILDLVGWPPSAAAPAPTDVARNNLYHDRIVRTVGAGLMELSPTGAFEPWRPVSGREALDVIEALIRLVGP